MIAIGSQAVTNSPNQAGADGIFLENALVKNNKALGRTNVYFKSAVSGKEYTDACVLMDAQLTSDAISRFSIRGIVGSDFDERSLLRVVSNMATPLEINKLPLDESRKFLWVSRNSIDRSPHSEELDKFISGINQQVSAQTSDIAVFEQESDRLFQVAEK